MTTTKFKLPLFTAVVLTTGFTLFWALSPVTEDVPIAQPPESQPIAVTSEPDLPLPNNSYSKQVSSQDVLGYDSKLGVLPDSLNGVYLGNALVVDEAGHLRISSDIKRVFDFFLSTINEEPLDTILARIDEYLNYYLDEPAISEAREILLQYVSFKEALVDYQQAHGESTQAIAEGMFGPGSGNLSVLENQLNARNGLRAEHLSAEVREAFFGPEEEYDQYTLSRLKINADQSLSPEERIQQLEQLDSSSPEHIIESRKRTQAVDVLAEKTQAIVDRGGSSEEVRALRTEMFGEEAAERFDALDKERQAWDQRLNDYLDQRQAILDNQGLSEEDQQDQIDALRADAFDTREQIRVRYLETQPRT